MTIVIDRLPADRGRPGWRVFLAGRVSWEGLIVRICWRSPRRDGVAKVLPLTVTYWVPKIRRGGFIFLVWAGDHSPRHVHVYRDGMLVVKWDLESWQPMKGQASARIKRLLKELVEEGRL